MQPSDGAMSAVVCPNCQSSNVGNARFCVNCGLRLTTEQPIEAPLFHDVLRAPKAAPAQGERRVITALFCDVVRSTALAEHLDPEEWREIMNRAFAILTGPIERYDGTVARLMGDAFLAFFGAPTAHEDDPQRAVFAALEIMNDVRPFAAQIKAQYGLDFAVRVGINTGPVVVGDVGSQRVAEYTAMGDAINLAARMEQAAQPGTIQIAEDTQRLVARIFDLEDLGGIDVKGKSAPVRAYRVLAAKAHPGRRRGVNGVSAPLIGRENELAQLRDALAHVKAGHGQVVCVIGEAGVGKSRLLDEARKAWLLENPAYSWEEVQSSPYDSARPYGLFQKYARDMFGIHLDDPPEVIHQKVANGFVGVPRAADMCQATMEKVIAAKAIRDTREYEAEAVKENLYGIATRAWENASAFPSVVVFDDVQWADQASVDLLLHVFRVTEDHPMVFVCAFRPERQSPGWQIKVRGEAQYAQRFTEIVLSPLDAQRTDDLISALLNIADLPRDLRALIVRRTEGNPYFIEEVVRSLIEQGIVYQTDDGLRWKSATKLDDIAIPDTLQALLVSRIDRLDAETRATLQLAAVIGRTFDARILRAVSGSTSSLDLQLAALQRVELVREVARKPGLEYMFRHELARDATYNTILLRRRRELHRHVGDAMEALFADRLEEQAHRLAQHFALAGESEKAYRYYVMAGNAAVAISADAEAAGHFTRALQAAETLSIPAAERARLESRVATLAATAAPTAS
jgi:class 3 adenylate cyclase